MLTSWLLLIVAGLLEVVWALAMKQSEGFTRLGWTALFLVTAVASMWLLARALRGLPVGTGYAVWTGIGAVGTVALGTLLLNEPMSIGKAASVGLVVSGIIGLALTQTS